MNVNIQEMIGKVLAKIDSTKDTIIFHVEDGTKYRMYHDQDAPSCCEHVVVDDIEGDLNDLVGSPILQAEESTNRDDMFGRRLLYSSFTWTFYKLATVKGYVTIRWLGESSGYYSESVDFELIEPEQCN